MEVAVLNDEAIVLHYEVVNTGKLIFCRSDEAQIEFFVRSIREYFDTEPLRAFFRKIMKQQIREGTFFEQPKRYANASR